jgi:hypothetical protein
MPNYEHAPVDRLRELREEVEVADSELRRLGGLPLQNLADAQRMKRELDSARELADVTRQEKAAAIEPLIAQIDTLEVAHDALIAAYEACAQLAEIKLREFDYLHDFDTKARKAPAQSSVPTARTRVQKPQRKRA